jgi:diguanylate cyclase (GGDEF)-like protein
VLVRTTSGPPRRFFEVTLGPHPHGGAIGVVHEVTDRERLDAAVGELATGVYTTDGDMRVTWLPRRIGDAIGIAPEAFVGTNVYALVHPDDVGATRELVERAKESPGVRFARPLRIRHPDQPDVWWPIIVHVVWLGDDAAVGGLLVRFDTGLAADLHVHAAEEAAQGLVTLGDTSPLGSLHLTLTGALQQRSTRVREILRPISDEGDVRWLELLRAVDRAAVAERLGAARMGAILPPVEVAFDGRGRTVWTRLDVLPYHDAHGQVAGMFVNLLDVTQEHQARDELTTAREELWHLANHDALTGLCNRYLFNDRLAAAVVGMAHHDGRSTVGHSTRPAVLVCDLDRFKEVNDAHGHRVGDAVLVESARRIESAVRGADLVSRFGGDEFLVLCERVADEHELEVVAGRVVERFSLPFLVDHLTLDVGISVGGAMAEAGDATDPDALVLRADRAMYRAKAAGRGRLVIA